MRTGSVEDVFFDAEETVEGWEPAEPSPSDSIVSPQPLHFSRELKAGVACELRLADRALAIQFDEIAAAPAGIEHSPGAMADVESGSSPSSCSSSSGGEDGENDDKDWDDGKEPSVTAGGVFTELSSVRVKNLDTGECKDISVRDLAAGQELLQFFELIGTSAEPIDPEAAPAPSSPMVARRRKRSRIRDRLGLGKKKNEMAGLPWPATTVPVRNSERKKGPGIGTVVMVQDIPLPSTVPIWCLGFSADCSMLAVGTQDGFVRVFDVEGGLSVLSLKPRWTLQGHDATVVSLQWEPTAGPAGAAPRHLLATTGLDKTLRIWDCAEGVQLACVHCSDWPVAVAFHPSIPGRVLTGNLGATVQVWSFGPSGNGRHKLEVVEYLKVSDLITALSISPNGKLLALGNRAGRVSLFDAVSLKFRFEVDCRNRRGRHARGRKVTGICWSNDSKKLCVSTNDSRIRLIDLNNLSWSKKFKGHTNERYMLKAQFSPDERIIVCASENSWLFSWETSSQESNLLRKDNSRVKRPTNASFDSFKGFEELVTSSIVAPGSVCDSFNTAFRSSQLKDGTRDAEFLSVAGSIKGRLRVFAAFGP